MRITMDRARIKEILVEEKYPEFMIEKTADKIESFSPVVAKAFCSWCERKEQINLVVEGISFNDLVSKWGMNPVGAFITLDWLILEPEKAKKALNRGIK
ncbi:MAG: hypothetical protein IIV45_00335 [Lachnospiraceae bacterium]|nr:hypothetical protein [Lachnospiraceae bacterium]